MVLTLEPGADFVAAIRAATGESVVVVMTETIEPLAQALGVAAIAPLAIERAPATRVNAIVASRSAALDTVNAAAIFLDGAVSTTGQVLYVR